MAGILYYNLTTKVFTETIDPTIIASSNQFMKFIRGADACKDASTGTFPQTGLNTDAASKALHVNLLFNTFMDVPLSTPLITPDGRTISTPKVGHAWISDIEDVTFANMGLEMNDADFNLQTNGGLPFLCDCGEKYTGTPPNPRLETYNIASILDSHTIMANPPITQQNITFNKSQLTILGLTRGAADNGIIINDDVKTSANIHENVTMFKVCGLDFFAGYTGQPLGTTSAMFRKIFDESDNPSKNRLFYRGLSPYTGAQIIDPSIPMSFNDPTNIPLIERAIVAKEMGDTLQAISIYTGIREVPLKLPLSIYLSTCDKGTFLTACQLNIPALYAQGTEKRYYNKGITKTYTVAELKQEIETYSRNALHNIDQMIKFYMEKIKACRVTHDPHPHMADRSALAVSARAEAVPLQKLVVDAVQAAVPAAAVAAFASELILALAPGTIMDGSLILGKKPIQKINRKTLLKPVINAALTKYYTDNPPAIPAAIDAAGEVAAEAATNAGGTKRTETASLEVIKKIIGNEISNALTGYYAAAAGGVANILTPPQINEIATGTATFTVTALYNSLYSNLDNSVANVRRLIPGGLPQADLKAEIEELVATEAAMIGAQERANVALLTALGVVAVRSFSYTFIELQLKAYDAQLALAAAARGDAAAAAAGVGRRSSRVQVLTSSEDVGGDYRGIPNGRNSTILFNGKEINLYNQVEVDFYRIAFFKALKYLKSLRIRLVVYKGQLDGIADLIRQIPTFISPDNSDRINRTISKYIIVNCCKGMLNNCFKLYEGYRINNNFTANCKFMYHNYETARSYIVQPSLLTVGEPTIQGMLNTFQFIVPDYYDEMFKTKFMGNMDALKEDRVFLYESPNSGGHATTPLYTSVYQLMVNISYEIPYTDPPNYDTIVRSPYYDQYNDLKTYLETGPLILTPFPVIGVDIGDLGGPVFTPRPVVVGIGPIVMYGGTKRERNNVQSDTTEQSHTPEKRPALTRRETPRSVEWDIYEDNPLTQQEAMEPVTEDANENDEEEPFRPVIEPSTIEQIFHKQITNMGLPGPLNFEGKDITGIAFDDIPSMKNIETMIRVFELDEVLSDKATIQENLKSRCLTPLLSDIDVPIYFGNPSILPIINGEPFAVDLFEKLRPLIGLYMDDNVKDTETIVKELTSLLLCSTLIINDNTCTILKEYLQGPEVEFEQFSLSCGLFVPQHLAVIYSHVNAKEEGVIEFTARTGKDIILDPKFIYALKIFKEYKYTLEEFMLANPEVLYHGGLDDLFEGPYNGPTLDEILDCTRRQLEKQELTMIHPYTVNYADKIHPFNKNKHRILADILSGNTSIFGLFDFLFPRDLNPAMKLFRLQLYTIAIQGNLAIIYDSRFFGLFDLLFPDALHQGLIPFRLQLFNYMCSYQGDPSHMFLTIPNIIQYFAENEITTETQTKFFYHLSSGKPTDWLIPGISEEEIKHFLDEGTQIRGGKSRSRKYRKHRKNKIKTFKRKGKGKVPDKPKYKTLKKKTHKNKRRIKIKSMRRI